MDTHASLMSQLGNEPCLVEDTEEMFWLRQSDDYQSIVNLGNKLSGQYRFREAIEAYQDAIKIKSDDYLTYQRIAGAYLTIRDFDNSLRSYNKALKLLKDEKPIAFTMGAYYYLLGDYKTSQEWLLKALPASGELKIAVIYWHTICSYRINEAPSLLEDYDTTMDVGHHEAYKEAVNVFKGIVSPVEALTSIKERTNSLDYPILAYGISKYYESIGDRRQSEIILQKILKHQNFWPCISYLAAFGDKN